MVVLLDAKVDRVKYHELDAYHLLLSVGIIQILWSLDTALGKGAGGRRSAEDLVFMESGHV